MTEPMEDLRRQFVAAARRQAEPSRGRRWWRNRVGIFLGVLLATGAVAEGVDLVSVGDPVERGATKVGPSAAEASGPAEGGGEIDVTSTDPNRSLPFAVIVYRRNGVDCATAGQLRGAELGEMRGGLFHSFEGRIGGACRDLTKADYVIEPTQMDGRSLVFGRARRGVKAMVLKMDGDTFRAKTGPRGGFLFVFDAGLAVGDIDDVHPAT